jgi:hypothetical protein
VRAQLQAHILKKSTALALQPGFTNCAQRSRHRPMLSEIYGWFTKARRRRRTVVKRLDDRR